MILQHSELRTGPIAYGSENRHRTDLHLFVTLPAMECCSLPFLFHQRFVHRKSDDHHRNRVEREAGDRKSRLVVVALARLTSTEKQD